MKSNILLIPIPWLSQNESELLPPARMLFPHSSFLRQTIKRNKAEQEREPNMSGRGKSVSAVKES